MTNICKSELKQRESGERDRSRAQQGGGFLGGGGEFGVVGGGGCRSFRGAFATQRRQLLVHRRRKGGQRRRGSLSLLGGHPYSKRPSTGSVWYYTTFIISFLLCWQFNYVQLSPRFGIFTFIVLFSIISFVHTYIIKFCFFHYSLLIVSSADAIVHANKFFV